MERKKKTTEKKEKILTIGQNLEVFVHYELYLKKKRQTKLNRLTGWQILIKQITRTFIILVKNDHFNVFELIVIKLSS